MKITNLKDAIKRIEQLEIELAVFNNSPLKESYLSTLNFLNRINKQIIEKEIDIFADGTKDTFGMCHKFMSEKQAYINNLESMRKAMTPDQQKELAKDIEFQNLGVAERMAIKARDGSK